MPKFDGPAAACVLCSWPLLLSSAAAESAPPRVSTNHKSGWPISTARSTTDQVERAIFKIWRTAAACVLCSWPLCSQGRPRRARRREARAITNLDGRFRLRDYLPITLERCICQDLRGPQQHACFVAGPLLLSSAAAESAPPRVSTNHKSGWPISTARSTTDHG